MRYIKLVDGKVEFVRLADEFPDTISPHLLSDEELAPILRVEIVRDELDFCEKYGEPELTIDGVVKYPAAPLSLEEAKAIAWDRVKAERAERQTSPMPYDFGTGYGVLHTSLTEKALADLTGSVTAALAMRGSDLWLAWTTDENLTVSMRPEAMIDFGLFAINMYSAIHLASQHARKAIELAETLEAVRIAVERW